jgi:diaminopimelate decarboxylase
MLNTKEGEIFIENFSVSQLCEEFGTPLYVYSSQKIKNNFIETLNTARKYYPNFELFYAIKACNNPNIANILIKEGAGIDAASINEIKLAKLLGLNGCKIMFSGNFLSDEDLKEGLDSGAIINLDDISLLPRLLKFGTPEIISFRINPGYGDSNVGEWVTNAGPKAKFGLHPNHVHDAYNNAKKAGIKRFGVHMMPGSCLLEPEYFFKITKMLLDIVIPIFKTLQIDIEFIDLGGGLGIPYENKEIPLDLDKTMRGISKIVLDECDKNQIKLPALYMEPARYFVGNAGILLGKVHTIKRSYTDIIGTDISMNILARPAMYDAYHHIYINGKEDNPRQNFGVCGQICENTDYWCRERKLPKTIEEGDIIAVADAGAYGFGMSYEYNGRLRPAEVLISNNEVKLIRKRETFSDMLRNVEIPDEMKKNYIY